MSVDARFRAYCKERGIEILRQLQVGTGRYIQHSSVFLVRDVDGLAKVYKQLPRPGAPEPSIFEHLGPLPFLPRYYGTTEVGEGLAFIRLGVCYGQSLKDYFRQENRLNVGEVCAIAASLARALGVLHERGVLHLDVEPQNVVLHGEDVYLLDLGDAQFVSDAPMDRSLYVHDPMYAAPETVVGGAPGSASDIFQLGVLMFELLVGHHPFQNLLPPEETFGERLRR